MNESELPRLVEAKSELILAFGHPPGQVMSPDMATTYHFQLDALDIGQVLDGLESRAEAWEKTAAYLRTEDNADDEFFLIEECSDPEEAGQIAEQFVSRWRRSHKRRMRDMTSERFSGVKTSAMAET